MIKKGEVIVKKADFLVPVLNWIIIKHHKNDNDNDDYDDNDDDDDDYYYYEDDRSVYGKTVDCCRVHYFKCPLYDLFTTNKPQSNMNGSR